MRRRYKTEQLFRPAPGRRYVPWLYLFLWISSPFVMVSPLHNLGVAIFILCVLAFPLFLRVYRRALPEEERPEELRGPRPGGFRLGGWYFNRADPRSVAFGRHGSPMFNYAARRNRPLLLLFVLSTVFAAGIIIWTVIAALLEG